MHRRFLLFIFAATMMLICADGFAAEPISTVIAQGDHSIDRGPGGYFSWVKLLLIVIAYLIWVKLSDWMNRDGQEVGKELGMPPEMMNMLSMGGFLAGFLAAITIPMFLIGYPLMLILGFLPVSLYFFIRRSKFLERPSLARRKESGPAAPMLLPQDDGVEVKFSPAGDSKSDQQRNLIQARRSPHFTDMKQLLHEGAAKRAQNIMMDFTREQVAAQMMVDGTWHPMPPMTREVGDAVLLALKNLAGLNAADRRNRQVGIFNASAAEKKLALQLTSQGTKTGERVQLKFVEKRKVDLTLPQLGMWPEMIKQLSQFMGQPGLVLVSAPPQGGLTSSWRAVLAAGDRITRDWVALVDHSDDETDVENVVINKYEKETEAFQPILKKLLLSQPDALVVPDITESELLDQLVEQAASHERTVVTRNLATSAAESMLRLYALAGDKPKFVQTLQCATGQRLVRRLCDTCKTPVQVQPQMIQKLGGDPKKINKVFKAYKLPPLDQRVDENGKPIEMAPCSVCGGTGYLGRIAIFEMISVTPQIREALLKQPKLEVIRKVANDGGDLNMSRQGYRLVLMGITTVSEIQRVMKGG